MLVKALLLGALRRMIPPGWVSTQHLGAEHLLEPLRREGARLPDCPSRPPLAAARLPDTTELS